MFIVVFSCEPTAASPVEQAATAKDQKNEAATAWEGSEMTTPVLKKIDALRIKIDGHKQIDSNILKQGYLRLLEG